VPAVVIERYDRAPDAPEGRIHQEDFNQVLGAAGVQKYQKHGGRVSLERVALVFSSSGDRDSLEHLFRLVVVSVAVGNLDLHAKNISYSTVSTGRLCLLRLTMSFRKHTKLAIKKSPCGSWGVSSRRNH